MTPPAPYPVVLLAAALFLSGDPGEAQQAGEAPPWPAVFHDTAEVRVVNVEVFVSDAAGRPVTGLGKDDFQLLVDGEPVEIRHFYAGEGGASAPAPAVSAAQAREEERRLYLAIFVDHPNIRAAHRESVFRHLRELVLDWRRPDLRMMVASRESAARDQALAGSSLVVRQDFTQVPHEVFAALDDLRSRTSAEARFALEERQLLRSIEALNADVGRGLTGIKGNPDLPLEALQATFFHEAQSLLPQIQAYGEQRHADALRTLGVLAQTVDLLAPLPGRKALVYVSDGFPARPGEEVFEAYARRLAGVAGVESDHSLQLEAARFDLTPDLLELIARANAGRVTFYTLNASPPASALRGAADNASLDTGAGVGEDSRLASLELIAGGTGGRAGLAPAAVAATLAGVLTDFDHYYSLGYLPGEPRGEGEEREIEVRLGDPKLRVRHRRGVGERGSEERMNERVLSALVLDPGAAGDDNLGVRVSVGEAKPNDDGHYVVPLRVDVPLGRLVLVPGAREHEARVTMYVAARDGAGRTSEVTRHLCPIRVPNSELLVALGRTMACGVRLLMREGAQTVAVAVRDEVAGTAAVVRLALDVPGERP